jgi:hypothetical protein
MSTNNFERVVSVDTLYRCWRKISTKNSTGWLDGVDVAFYRADLQKNLRSLQKATDAPGYLIELNKMTGYL